jgi:hypothetical protein
LAGFCTSSSETERPETMIVLALLETETSAEPLMLNAPVEPLSEPTPTAPVTLAEAVHTLLASEPHETVGLLERRKVGMVRRRFSQSRW